MTWTAADRRWLRRLKEYVTKEDKLDPEDVGFFNGGQKLYFWAIAVSGVRFLITGLLLWFDDLVARWIVAGSYVIHDLAALVMLAVSSFTSTKELLIKREHRSMIDGTVTEKWAWTHHPAWYKRDRPRSARCI
jgi:formate dehydrogenase subunit gamma